MRGILYYDTKYGTTKKIGRWIISEISICKMEMLNINNKPVLDKNCDFYVLGCPIYIGKPREEMNQFIIHNKEYMRDKPIFLFIISWAQATVHRNECNRFLELIEYSIKPAKITLSMSLPGSLILEDITYRDRNVIMRLVARIDKLSERFHSDRMEFLDNTDEKESRNFGKAINNWLQHSCNMF